MTSPFAQPAAPSSGIKWADYNGALILFSVQGLEQNVSTVHGPSDAVRCNIAVLDGPGAGEEHENILVFPKLMRAQLSNRVGSLVLGRLGQGVAKAGQSAPWLINPATEQDQQIGSAWLAKRQAPVAPDPAPAQAAPAAQPQGASVPF